MDVRRVVTVDTWEVEVYLDKDGKEQEDWELVDMKDYPSTHNKGGERRKQLLSPQRRREIATKAARVRWGKKERKG